MAILFFVCHGNAVRPGRAVEKGWKYNDLVTLGSDVELRRCQMNGKFTKMKERAFDIGGNKYIDGPKNLFKQVINGSDYFGPDPAEQQPPKQQQYRNIEIFIGKNPGFLGIYEWGGTPNKYPIKCRDNNPNGCLFYLDEFNGKDYNGIRSVVAGKGFKLENFKPGPHAICIIGCFPPEVRINTAIDPDTGRSAWHPQDLSEELIDIPQLIEYGQPEKFLWKSFWLRTKCKESIKKTNPFSTNESIVKIKSLITCLKSSNTLRKLSNFPTLKKEDIRLLLNLRKTFDDDERLENILKDEFNNKNTITNGIYQRGGATCQKNDFTYFSDSDGYLESNIVKVNGIYYFDEISDLVIESLCDGGSKRKKKKSKKKKTKRRKSKRRKSRKSKRRKTKTLRPSRKSYRRN